MFIRLATDHTATKIVIIISIQNSILLTERRFMEIKYDDRKMNPIMPMTDSSRKGNIFLEKFCFVISVLSVNGKNMFECLGTFDRGVL